MKGTDTAARRRTVPVMVLLGLATLSGCAAGAASPAETATGSIRWGGLERSYRIHVPSSHGKTGRSPLVIALHGGGGTGERMERLTLGGLNRLADRDGFVVVYPDGIEKHWNDGREKVRYRAHREKIDDVGFISALIDALGGRWNIDRTRVYVTGISNGAMMSNRLACELAGKIAAIAPVAGNMPLDLAPRCTPARPVPVLMISGTKDRMMPWEGGEARFGRLEFGRVLSVMETIGFWAAHNGCTPTPAVPWEPDKDSHDGARVRKVVHGECRDETEVVLYAIEDGGHTWPGGSQYLPEAIVGTTARDLDANEVVWEFFRRFGRRQPGR